MPSVRPFESLIKLCRKNAKNTRKCVFFCIWRSGRDSNPRAAHHDNTISSRARYDLFDTTPRFIALTVYPTLFIFATLFLIFSAFPFLSSFHFSFYFFSPLPLFFYFFRYFFYSFPYIIFTLSYIFFYAFFFFVNFINFYIFVFDK